MVIKKSSSTKFRLKKKKKDLLGFLKTVNFKIIGTSQERLNKPFNQATEENAYHKTGL